MSMRMKNFPVSQLPQTSDHLLLRMVRALINDMVVLVEDYNLVPWSLLVESFDRGDCDAEVNNSKQHPVC